MPEYDCTITSKFTYFMGLGNRVRSMDFKSPYDLTGESETSRDGSITTMTKCSKK